jgi:hypothetical protein
MPLESYYPQEQGWGATPACAPEPSGPLRLTTDFDGYTEVD